MYKIRYHISRVLSILTVVSIAWLIIESVMLEIVNFGLLNNFSLYYDSLIFVFMLIPIALIYNWLIFGEITVWMERPKPKDIDGD
tara:strand:- start:396 stop:650 length:255 start_codon:yes stop_codon:yes gene_type:complete